MVPIGTKSIRLTTNGSFRETINQFQDCNIKKKTKKKMTDDKEVWGSRVPL